METRRRESREFQPLGFCKGRGSSRTQFGSVYLRRWQKSHCEGLRLLITLKINFDELEMRFSKRLSCETDLSGHHSLY